MQRHRAYWVVAAICAGAWPFHSIGAGFALLEQSGSSMGHAVAGSAASAEDASTIFFNPAGLTRLRGLQTVVTGHGIGVKSKFSGGGSNSEGFASGGQGGNAGRNSFLPNLYFSYPVGDKFAAGVGINVPFGLATEYDEDWVGRFQGIKSELRTLNVNPSVAYKLSDRVALGFGLNWQRADVELTNAVRLAPATEGRTRLEADDDSFGWNAGALFDVAPDMRLGMSYRSSMRYKMKGNVNTTFLSTGATAATFDATAEAELPDIATLSIVQNYGEKWDLLGDLMFTRWSVLKRVNVVQSSNGAVRDTLIFDFKDAWRVALGLNYRKSERWIIKGGIGYDMSPVEDHTRTARLPDADRLWLSIGAKYKLSPSASLDIAYSHLFGMDAPINFTKTQTASTFTSTVTGEYELSVDILSAQIAFTF